MNNNYPINSNVLGLERVLSSDYTYMIPAYQRPYEWNEQNLEDFLQTLTEGYRSNKQVFFGTMQIAQNDKNEAVWDIVDGQQRLSTFILFFNLFLKEDEKPLYLERITNNPINGLFNIDQGADYLRKFNINKYKENYDTLQKIIDVYLKDNPDDNIENIKKYALNNVYMVVLQTSKDMPLSDVVEVFNTINTTGLALNAADVFKFRYYDFLNTYYKKSDIEWMEKINECYELIERSNADKTSYDRIEMSWILDVYKHILCAKFSFGFSELSKSNMTFFNDLFYAKKYQDKLQDSILSYESFRFLVECFIDNYRWIEKSIRKESYDSDPMELFSYHMLSKTRYSRYWTIPFVATFFALQRGEKNENNIVYINSQKITLSFFKYFLIYSVQYAKVINDVQNRVCYLLRDFVDCNYVKICTKVENFMWRQYTNTYDQSDNLDTNREEEWFRNYIEKDLYENGSRAHLVCTLSALLEELNNDNPTPITEIQKKLFDWKNQPYDIEHIWARESYNNDPEYKNILKDEDRKILNGIGNLVVLNRSINRKIKDKSTIEKKKEYTSVSDKEFSYRIIDNICKGDQLEKWQDVSLEEVQKRKESEKVKLSSFMNKRDF